MPPAGRSQGVWTGGGSRWEGVNTTEYWPQRKGDWCAVLRWTSVSVEWAGRLLLLRDGTVVPGDLHQIGGLRAVSHGGSLVAVCRIAVMCPGSDAWYDRVRQTW